MRMYIQDMISRDIIWQVDVTILASHILFSPRDYILNAPMSNPVFFTELDRFMGKKKKKKR